MGHNTGTAGGSVNDTRPVVCHGLRAVPAREQAYFDPAVADIFGFHAMQIGLPECPFLAQSRIASRWTLDYDPPADVIADPHGIAVRRKCARFIVLPHALEFTDDPHLHAA
jgi:hypothetical protein